MTAPGPLTVAFICTGNRFRSPIAELLFRRAAGDVPVRTISRGTLELAPLPALIEAMEEGGNLGLDLSKHRSRGLAGEDLSGSDLVIGFERMHVVAAVVEANAPRDRTFTLPEIVELLEETAPGKSDDPLERARQAIGAAAAKRGETYAPPELGDPLGRSRRVFRETAAALDDLVARLAGGLFGR